MRRRRCGAPSTAPGGRDVPRQSTRDYEQTHRVSTIVDPLTDQPDPLIGDPGSDHGAVIDRARPADHAAFAHLYLTFHQRVHRYMQHALPIADDAEEGTQDVFVKVLTNLDRYDGSRDRFEHWLFRIARNHALDRHKRTGRPELTDPQVLTGMVVHATAAADAGSPEDFEALTSSLSDTQRCVLTLRYRGNFSLPEIAQLLGKTHDCIRQTHSRALRTLARNASPSATRRGPLVSTPAAPCDQYCFTGATGAT